MSWYQWCLLATAVLFVVGLAFCILSGDYWGGTVIGVVLILFAICFGGGAYGVKAYGDSKASVRVVPAPVSSTNTFAVK
jgi:hypothetical protein